MEADVFFVIYMVLYRCPVLLSPSTHPEPCRLRIIVADKNVLFLFASSGVIIPRYCSLAKTLIIQYTNVYLICGLEHADAQLKIIHPFVGVPQDLDVAPAVKIGLLEWGKKYVPSRFL